MGSGDVYMDPKKCLGSWLKVLYDIPHAIGSGIEEKEKRAYKRRKERRE